MANAIEVKLMPALPQMLEKATHTGSLSDRKQRNHIKAIHRYMSTVEISTEVIAVGIITREKAAGHEHYDHFIVSTNEKPPSV